MLNKLSLLSFFFFGYSTTVDFFALKLKCLDQKFTNKWLLFETLFNPHAFLTFMNHSAAVARLPVIFIKSTLNQNVIHFLLHIITYILHIDVATFVNLSAYFFFVVHSFTSNIVGRAHKVLSFFYFYLASFVFRLASSHSHAGDVLLLMHIAWEKLLHTFILIFERVQEKILDMCWIHFEVLLTLLPLHTSTHKHTHLHVSLSFSTSCSWKDIWYFTNWKDVLAIGIFAIHFHNICFKIGIRFTYFVPFHFLPFIDLHNNLLYKNNLKRFQLDRYCSETFIYSQIFRQPSAVIISVISLQRKYTTYI